MSSSTDGLGDGSRRRWWSPRKRPASPRAVAAGGVVGVLLFAGWASMFYDRDQHLGTDAPVAQAVVLEVREGSGRVTVEFATADGDPVRAETEEFRGDPFPEVGDRVTVRYHPDDPEYYVRDVRWAAGRDAPMAGAFALVFLRWVVLGVRGKVPAEIRYFER